MSNIFEQYYGNLLADAAYVNFGAVGPNTVLSGDDLIDLLTASGRFTESQARSIADCFEVVATSSIGSFQGVVFRERELAGARPDGTPAENAGYGREPGRLWVATRGTESPGDDWRDLFVADPSLAVTGVASSQDEAAATFFRQLSDPNAYGLIGANTRVNFTGHSLGGHLAINLAITHPTNVAQLYTVNTANVGGFGLWNPELFFATAQALGAVADVTTNIQAIPGLQIIGSSSTGLRTGLESLLMTEAKTVALTPGDMLQQHFIRPLTDFFEVARILAIGFDESVANVAINHLFDAASALRTTSLESLLAPIWRLLFPSESFPLNLTADANTNDAADDLFHSSTERIFRTLTSAAHGTYNFISMVGSTESLEALANQSDAIGLAVRDALVNGDQYAVVGANHSSAYALENFSSTYLHERARFLASLLAANSTDSVTTDAAPILVSGDTGRDSFFESRLPGGGSRFVASSFAVASQIAGGNTTIERTIFANSTGGVIQGADGDDKLFGNVGSDILEGGRGDDYLEGGAGTDTLKGGDGHDILYGGAGDDILEGGAGPTDAFGGEGNDTYRFHSGDGALDILDTDGEGRISVLMDGDSRIYQLGNSPLIRQGANSNVWLDGHQNRFVLDDQTLRISLEDGGQITIRGYLNGDLGLNLLPPENSSPAGHTYNPKPDNSDNPEGLFLTDPEMVESINSIGYFTPYLVSHRGWISGNGFYHRNDAETINAIADTTESPDVPYSTYIVRGGMGDSTINGDDGRNTIEDDSSTYWSGGVSTTQWQVPDHGLFPLSDDFALGIFGFNYTMADVMGNDTIHAGGGDDLVMTSGGDDTVYGGDGNDTLVDSHAGMEARFDESYTFNGITAQGVSYRYHDDLEWDNQPGHSSNDLMFGEGGNDILIAHGGRQVMDGGDGDDSLAGGAHNDVLIGGAGNDVLGGDLHWDQELEQYFSEQQAYGSDFLDGGDGDDFLYGGGGADTLVGGEGNDYLDGDFRGAGDIPADPAEIGGIDQIDGGAGNDTIYGGAGNDDLSGGDGEDVIHGESGDDTIDGGDGADILYGDEENATGGKDEIHGGGGADQIYGRNGDDRLFGDAGMDVLEGGFGNDRLEGGADDDILRGNENDDYLVGGGGHDQLYGGGQQDVLVADSGNDELYGEDGNDTFVVNAGAGHVLIDDTQGLNTLKFGSGVIARDLQLRIAGGHVFIDFAPGDSVEMSAATYAQLAPIAFSQADAAALSRLDLEKTYKPPVLQDSNAIVTLTNGVTVNQVTVDSDNDNLVLIYNGGQANWVDSTSLDARDILYRFEPGSNFGGATGSKAIVLVGWYRNEPSTNLRELRDSAAGVRDLVSLGLSIERSITGSAGDDLLVGGQQASDLFGLAGNDLLMGRSGNDFLRGDTGDDLMIGGKGDDTYTYRVGDGADVVIDEAGVDWLRLEGIGLSSIVFTQEGASIRATIGNPSAGQSVLFSGIDYLELPSQSLFFSAAEINSFLTGNRPPQVNTPASDAAANVGTPFSWTIGATAFVDPNAGDTLTYSVSRYDGAPMPSWLSFDPATRTLSGTPTANDLASFRLMVEARDTTGLTSTATFDLNVFQGGTIGTDSGDLLTGTAGADTIAGLEGQDQINGNGGDDRLIGGSGNDSINGGTGNDVMIGGLGDDNYTVDSAGDVIVENVDEGTDRVFASFSYALQPTLENLTLQGSSAIDGTGNFLDNVLTGNTGANVLSGMEGNDTLTGGTGNDTLVGGAGNDTYVINATDGVDVITDVSGLDTVSFNTSIATSQVSFQRRGDDLEAVIRGTLANRVIVRDWFVNPASRIESWKFGTSTILSMTDVEAQLSLNHKPLVDAGVPDVTLPSGESIAWTFNADAFLDADVGDVLTYTATLSNGAALPAWLTLNSQTRQFSGTSPTGTGFVDVLVRATDSTGQFITDTFRLNYSPSTLTGTSGDDTFVGTPMNETFFGLAGQDILQGMGGDDTLWGGDGDDYLEGGAGSDTLIGGPGDDNITAGAGTDTIIINRGDEDDTISSTDALAGEADTIVFGPGIAPTDLVFSTTNGNGDLFIRIKEVDGTLGDDSIRLPGYLTPENLQFRLGGMVFTDYPAATLSQAQIDALALVPSAGSDYLRGTEVADTIAGLGGSDWIYGMGGDDVIDGGAGLNNLVGGAGNDTIYWDVSGNLTTIYGTGASNTDVDTLVIRDLVPSQIRVTHPSASDIRIEVPTSSTGFYSLTLAGEGTGLSGGAVIDRVEFEDAPGVVWTSADLRRLALIGADRDDTIDGFDTADVLRGGAGGDVLRGGLGADIYEFGRGSANDVVVDNSGSNTIRLDAGIAPANLQLIRTSSRDYRNSATATSDSLVIMIDGGSDQLRIENFFDGSQQARLEFAGGVVWDDATIRANIIDQSGAQNSVTGGGGDDSFVVDHRDDNISESSGGGTDTVTSSVTYTLPTNVENLVLTGSLNLLGQGNALVNAITGNNAANQLLGLAGNDVLNGNGGNDLLDGGSGDDTMAGGVGDDVYVVDTTQTNTIWSQSSLQNIRDVVVEAPGEGVDTMRGTNVYSLTMPDNVENLVVDGIISYVISYSANEDVRRKFVGNALDNRIEVQSTNVGLGVGVTFIDNGAGGEIVIDGGAGADLMIGSSASRTRFVVDNPGDVVVANGDITTIETSLQYTLLDGYDNLVLTGSAAVNGTGNAGNNELSGVKNSAANVLTGGNGDDTYYLGAGDTAIEAAGGGSDTLFFGAPAPGSTYVLDDFVNFEHIGVLDSVGSAVLIGNAGNNNLTGNIAANSLFGGAGDDRLAGLMGNDSYSDLGANSGHDTIIDTDGNNDVLQYSSLENLSVDSWQFSRVGDDMLIVVGPNSSVQLTGWYASSFNKIESLRTYNQGLSFSYNQAEMESRVSGVNLAPRVGFLSTPGTAGVDTAFSYQFAANCFLDIGSQSTLTYSVSMGDGGDLPTWLTFDTQTRTLSGSPTMADAGFVDLYLTATDSGGLSTTSSVGFNVDVLPIQGTEGDDNLTGTALNDQIFGYEGDDTLFGLDGDDDLEGDDGNDVLDGGAGADYMYGGLGNDIFYVDSVDDTVDESSGEGTDEVRSTTSLNLQSLGWTAVENLTLLGTGAINGTGNNLANVITGNSAANVLSGGSGNDTLDGGGGADDMTGGSGNDIFVVDNAGDVVHESSGGGTDTVQSSVTFTLATNFENLTLIGSGNIDGTGNSANNTLTGNSGNNRLNGSSGTDTLIGGAGDDTYVVDSTTDTITELAGGGTDTVETSVTFSINTTSLQNVIENLAIASGNTTTGITLTGNGLNNVLTGSSVANTLTGNDGNDTLNGLGGNDTLNGGNGNDILDGGTGNDGMTGGAGDDTYVVDSTTDTVTEATGGGTDTIQTSVQLTSWAANVENMTLLGTGALNTPTTTSSANNIIIGNSAANTLNGGAGDDTLTGAGGNDSLIGGTGADTYLFNAGDGTDTIDNSSTDSLVDRLQFLNLSSDQVTFTKSGNNLVMTRTAVPTDKVTVTNWFSATGNRLDFVNFTNREVTAAQIDTLANGGGGSFPLSIRQPISLQATFPSIAPNLAEGTDKVVAATAVFDQQSVPVADAYDDSVQAMLATEQMKMTLGGKSGSDSLHPRLLPIKNYTLSSADTGFDRLVDAMATFGTDLVTDAGSPGETLELRALEHLAAHQEIVRGNHAWRGEWRTLAE